MATNHLPPFLTTTPPPVSPPTIPRLEALYASSSAQRQSNPTGYAANASWWAGVITEGLRSGWINGAGGDRLVVKVDDALGERYAWEGKRPRGLAGFTETLLHTTPPTLYPLPAFTSLPTPILAPPTIVKRYVGRPLWWALSQLNPFGGESEATEEDMIKAYAKGKEYVHVVLLQQAAALFRQHVMFHPPTAYSESVHDIATFHATYARFCVPPPSGSAASSSDLKADSLSKRDMEVLVKWLMRDEGVVVTDGSIVKVLDPGESAAEHEITDVDRNVVSVLNALRRVDAQIAKIEEQVAACQVKAKTYIASSQKNLAMSQLRTRKALEDVLDKRLGVAEQLRSVIRGIDQASSDVEVMAAYETSNSTLRTLLANPLLDKDRVEQTTERLAETLADQREIDDAIRLGGAVAVGTVDEMDEGELESELQALVEEEKERTRVAEEKERARVAEELKRGKEKREAAEASAKAKEEVERQKAVAEAKARREELSAQQAAKQHLESRLAALSGTSTSAVQDEHQIRYDEAQKREREERKRAAVEQRKRDEARLIAD